MACAIAWGKGDQSVHWTPQKIGYYTTFTDFVNFTLPLSGMQGSPLPFKEGERFGF
jgi:hypothetical protein